MIKAAAATSVKKARKNLSDIMQKDIPGAKRAAYKRAGTQAISTASRQLATRLRVPVWMVRGQRGKGSRFGLSYFVPRGTQKGRESAAVYLRYRHINPTGTKHKAAKVTTTKRGVRAAGRLFENAYHDEGRWGNGVIMVRESGGRKRIARIEITDGDVAQVRRTLDMVFPKAFKKRFEHEFNRRVSRRGAR